MTSNTILIFRAVLVVDLLLTFIALLRESPGPDPYASMDEGTATTVGLVVLLTLAGYFVSLVGLWLFRWWGSLLFLGCLVVIMAISVGLVGFTQTFLAGPLEILSTLTGATIVYVSHFGKREHFS